MPWPIASPWYFLYYSLAITLLWCHNEHDGASNHQPHDGLLNHLFRCRSKKTSKLRFTGLCVGNSPVTGEFPTQRASKAENVSIWWCHHKSGLFWVKIVSNISSMLMLSAVIINTALCQELLPWCYNALTMMKSYSKQKAKSRMKMWLEQRQQATYIRGLTGNLY